MSKRQREALKIFLKLKEAKKTWQLISVSKSRLDPLLEGKNTIKEIWQTISGIFQVI